MKLQLLTFSLALKSSLAIYNIQVGNQTADAFSVKWQDDNPSGDYYQVELVNRFSQESVDAVETPNTYAEFTGLEGASIFDVIVRPMNGTDQTPINDGNRAEARTNGQRVIVSQEWGTGAQGYVLWNLPSEEDNSCGTSFSFGHPCDNADFFSLGVGDTVGVQNEGNQTLKVHVANKAGLNQIQWVAFGAACNWTAFAAEDYVIEPFSGYAQTTVELSYTNTTWQQVPGQTVRQLTIDIPEEYRQDCAPTATIDVNCESTVVGGWSFDLDENTGVFDENTGIASFSGSMSNDWIPSFGFTYSSSDECADEPVVTLNYQARN